MNDNSYQKSGRIMFVLAWILVFALLFTFFQFQQQSSMTGSQEIEHGKLILTADSQGHYMVKGQINNRPVHFLVDTGATMIAISKPLADSMQITGQYPVSMNTAAGTVKGYLTRIQTLSFGNFHFNNVKAVIMPENNDDMALLGMNVLSEFKISQQNNQLIIER